MSDCTNINSQTKLSDAISYNSSPTTCSGINTCDELNDILLKYNNKICEISETISNNTISISEITNAILEINNDITNINNQLFECCPICDFTGTATQITTTTTSTSSTTTTTTTTVIFTELQRGVEGTSTDTATCLQEEPTIPVYKQQTIPNDIQLADILYTNISGTSEFDGQSRWWKIKQGSNQYACFISDDGIILGLTVCI